MSGIDPALLAAYFRAAKGEQLDRILADAVDQVHHLDATGKLDDAAFELIRAWMWARIDQEAHAAIEELVVGVVAVHRASGTVQ